MRELAWIGSAVLIGYGAVVAYLVLYQRQLLYRPDPTRPTLGSLAPLGVREIAITTADGLSLLVWYLPPAGAGRPVIAYFHGNGGHLGYRADRFERFAREGWGVLMPEYRGYGGNPGAPDETGLYRDAAAALDFLRGEGIEGSRLVLYGESLGSGVAVEAATGREIGALILEAAFTSVPAAAQYHYPYVPARLLVRDRFDSLSRIARVNAPVLMLHGERDTIVPPRLSAALFAAAAEPKERWLARDGGHEDLARFGALDAAVAFVERRLGPR